MHVLHRNHQVDRAALAAVAAAVLAIVLALAVAGTVNDLSSPPTAGGVPTAQTAVHPSAVSPRTSNLIIDSPFTTGTVSVPIGPPWASGPRQASGVVNERLG